MGLFDAHEAWGISASYVPRATIVSAIQSSKGTVTPVVDWVSAAAAFSNPDAGRNRASPVLNRGGSVAIAVAVTWPSGVRPVAVELVDLGAKASLSGGSGRGRPAGPVGLVEPLPAIVRSFPSGLHAVLALATVLWELRSGTFFLPPGDLPTAPSGWLTDGWRPGQYEFRVTLSTGEVKNLPFRIIT